MVDEKGIERIQEATRSSVHEDDFSKSVDRMLTGKFW